jgi:hypothetical protein
VRKILGISLLTIALLQLGVRGIQRLRSDVPMWDFVSVYSAARTWIHGGDPYDLPRVAATWRESGVFTRRDTSLWATVYPPTSLITLVPLAMLPSSVAMMAWLAITIALLSYQFVALIDLAKLQPRDPRRLILVGGALAAAPLQFGLLSGQLSLPAISLCIIAFWYVGRDREKLAGALLAFACAIKPQVGAPFVAYFLVQRRRVVSSYAILLGAAIGALALATMRLSHVNWIAGWTQSIAVSSKVGGVNDYGWTNEFRDEIIDLKMLLVSMPVDALALRIMIECVVIALVAWYVRSLRRGRDLIDRQGLLPLAGLCALSLLPVYHRVYDATLLTAALAWALAELSGSQRRYALATFVPLALFLVPFDIVQSAQYRMPGLWRLAQTQRWQMFIAPHYAWGLLGVTVVLLAAMNRQVKARSSVRASLTRPASAR